MAHSVRLDSQFEVRKIATESIVVAMPGDHRFAGQEDVQLKELEGEHYIDRLRCEFREKYFESLNKNNIRVQVVMRAEREDFVVAAVNNGLGITMMPILHWWKT